jgi:hypothetical protein
MAIEDVTTGGFAKLQLIALFDSRVDFGLERLAVVLGSIATPELTHERLSREGVDDDSMLSRDGIVVEPQRASLWLVGHLAAEEQRFIVEQGARHLRAVLAYYQCGRCARGRGPARQSEWSRDGHFTLTFTLSHVL